MPASSHAAELVLDLRGLHALRIPAGAERDRELGLGAKLAHAHRGGHGLEQAGDELGAADPGAPVRLDPRPVSPDDRPLEQHHDEPAASPSASPTAGRT